MRGLGDDGLSSIVAYSAAKDGIRSHILDTAAAAAAAIPTVAPAAHGHLSRSSSSSSFDGRDEPAHTSDIAVTFAQEPSPREAGSSAHSDAAARSGAYPAPLPPPPPPWWTASVRHAERRVIQRAWLRARTFKAHSHSLSLLGPPFTYLPRREAFSSVARPGTCASPSSSTCPPPSTGRGFAPSSSHRPPSSFSSLVAAASGGRVARAAPPPPPLQPLLLPLPPPPPQRLPPPPTPPTKTKVTTDCYFLQIRDNFTPRFLVATRP